MASRMIRFCRRLISQDCTRYNSMCLLLRMDCNSLLPSHVPVPSLGNNQCFSNLTTPPTVKEDAGIPEISMGPQVTSIIETVQYFGFNEFEVKNLMKAQPDLIKTTSNLWNNVVGSLLEAGFEKNDIFTILERWPKVLFLKKSDLDKNILAWLNSGLGKDLFLDVLTTHPYFLQVNHSHISKRMKQYQLHFESKKRVGKMLLLAPNILEESWSVLFDKLNYLDELCIEKSDIASSGVLAHSGFHIKARHEFLIRAGIYKRPQKNFNKRLSKNPKLHVVVNTTDKEFVNGVAKLSRFEYNVFLEMFEEELRDSEGSYDSGSDSDSDSES